MINGCGCRRPAIAHLLYRAGARRLLVCDRRGIIYPGKAGYEPLPGRPGADDQPRGEQGDLATALRDADVFVGVSAANLVSGAMVKTMAPTVIFAMANPDPEIRPEEAKKVGPRSWGTGRSGLPQSDR